MARSKNRLAADWFAKIRQNATTGEVEHTDVADMDLSTKADTSYVDTQIANIDLSTKADVSYVNSQIAGIDAGKILQVKQSAFSATISWTSYNDITGSGVTITPSSTNSKIYVMVESIGTQQNGANNGALRIWAQNSEIADRVMYGGASGMRSIMPFNLNLIHSPNTTSAVTYYAQWERRNGGGLGTANFGAKGTITVMEVAQ